ncbi:MAG: hypothetical protein AAFQ98_22340, partial [Bacteroidota bacterium]
MQLTLTNQGDTSFPPLTFVGDAGLPFHFFPIGNGKDFANRVRPTSNADLLVPATLDSEENLTLSLGKSTLVTGVAIPDPQAQLSWFDFMVFIALWNDRIGWLQIRLQAPGLGTMPSNLSQIAGTLGSLTTLERITVENQDGSTVAQIQYLRTSPSKIPSTYFLIRQLPNPQTSVNWPDQSQGAKALFDAPPTGWTSHEIIPSLQSQISIQKTGKYLLDYLAQNIESIQSHVNSFIQDLTYALQRDDLRQSRIDTLYRVFGSIIAAAAYSIPVVGSTVQHVVKFMQDPNLNDAWWLTRS